MSEWNPQDFGAFLRRKGYSAGTSRTYTRTAARVWEAETVQAWFDARFPAGQRQRAGTIGSVRSACVLLAEFKGEPFAPHKVRAEQEEDLIEALTPSQAEAFSKQLESPRVDTDLAQILNLILETGLRIHEVVKLSGSDRSPRGGREGLSVQGKGSKRRWVPLSARGLQLVDALPQRGPFFPALRDPTKPLSPDDFRRRWNMVRGELGEPAARVHPHLLRHTFATRLAEKGVQIKVISRLLGHNSITTTERYLHASQQALMDAIDL